MSTIEVLRRLYGVGTDFAAREGDRDLADSNLSSCDQPWIRDNSRARNNYAAMLFSQERYRESYAQLEMSSERYKL